MALADNEPARQWLWVAIGYLVHAGEVILGDAPTRRAWEDIRMAAFCLQEAHCTLTEVYEPDVVAIMSEIAPVPPPSDVITEDDARCANLHGLVERLVAIARLQPPDTATQLTQILDDLRALYLSLGFQLPSTSEQG